MNREIRYTLRFTTVEFEALKRNADEAEMSVATLIRQALRQRAQLDAVASEYRRELVDTVHTALDAAERKQSADLRVIAEALGKLLPGVRT